MTSCEEGAKREQGETEDAKAGAAEDATAGADES
jgi:hypothetical protein